MTKTEKIISQGGKVMCDICHRMVVYGLGWMMAAPNKEVFCPGCVSTAAQSGKTLVGM